MKCDGELPCAYCVRKDRAATCAFSSPIARSQAYSAAHTPTTGPRSDDASFRRVRSAGHTPDNRDSNFQQDSSQGPRYQHTHIGNGTSLSPILSREDQQEDTVVPLEGRILRDAQGKLIFIGDCAPLSFLQTVRHLITSEVDPTVSVQAARDPIIEITRPALADQQQCPPIELHQVDTLVEEYIAASSGLVQLFQCEDLLPELKSWANDQTSSSDDVAAAVFHLVLAIGAQDKYEEKAEAWFKHALDVLLKHMCSSMNVSTVQGFTLVAIFMLRAAQPNGAYLYFCKLCNMCISGSPANDPQLWLLVLPMRLACTGLRLMLLSVSASDWCEIAFGRAFASLISSSGKFTYYIVLRHDQSASLL